MNADQQPFSAGPSGHCEQNEERLSALLDGELSAEEQQLLAQHLEECENCRALKDRFARINRAIEANPPRISETLQSRIDAELQRGSDHTPIQFERGVSEGHVSPGPLRSKSPVPPSTNGARVADAQQPHLSPSARGSRAPARRHQLFRLATAAVLMLGVSLTILVTGDRADASKLVEPATEIQAMNLQLIREQEVLLQTFAWELKALQVQLDHLDVDETQAEALRERIASSLERVESVALSQGADQ